jgi:hypothetical protein
LQATQPASTDQVEDTPPEHEVMVVDNVDDETNPSEPSRGKRKEQPLSMEEYNQHLIVTRNGGIAHAPDRCEECKTFQRHMRRSHASTRYTELCRWYIERNSPRLLQEEYDRGRADERDRALDSIGALNDELDRVRAKLHQLREGREVYPTPMPPPPPP